MPDTLSPTRSWILSLAGHAALVGVLLIVLASPPGGPGPRRIEAGLEIPIALEDAAPPLEPEIPVARESAVPPDAADEISESSAVEAEPFPGPEAEAGARTFRDDGPEILGIGRGRAPARRRSARPAPAAEAAAAAVDPLPAPRGPTTRARPLAGACPAPRYPARERRLGVEGVVRLRVRVADDGAVEAVEVEASSGSAALDAAAVEAVLGWRFACALRDGDPASDVVLVPVRFVLLNAAAAQEE